MKKSPSELFSILTEENADVQQQRSLSVLRATSAHSSLPHRTSLSKSRKSEESTGRGGNLAQLSIENHDVASPLASEAPEDAAFQAEELESDTAAEHVLVSLLGDLYVPLATLSDFLDIGEGGFAKVKRAQLTHRNGMKQVVAVKELREDRVQDTQDLHEFIAEANLWRKLQSRDIVKLVGIGAKALATVADVKRSLYFVSEYMEGGTLRDVVQKQMMSSAKDVYTAADVFRWFIGVTRAVKYLHKCRPAIIHRDMKPENVLLTTSEPSTSEAKVMDLGLHMRGRKAGLPNANAEGSFYGGSAYDAIAFNGSVYSGNASLADKVLQVEARAQDGATLPSPPRTNTRHGSRGGDSGLMPITEERAEDMERSERSHPNSKNLIDDMRLEMNRTAAADSHSGSRADRTAPATEGAAAKAAMPRVQSDNTMVSRTSGSTTFGANHTQQVGSYMYMAPEMTSSHKYTEKVDVFSITVMLYEALRGHLNILKIAMRGDPGDIARYAERVADGFRETVPKAWPEGVRALIADGWHQDPELRIDASEFLTRLSDLVDAGVPAELDRLRELRAASAGQACCSVM